MTAVTEFRRRGGGGQHWDPLEHPRDNRGRFIETGANVMIGTGMRGKVTRIIPNRAMNSTKVEVQLTDGRKGLMDASSITVVDKDKNDLPDRKPIGSNLPDHIKKDLFKRPGGKGKPTPKREDRAPRRAEVPPGRDNPGEGGPNSKTTKGYQAYLASQRTQGTPEQRIRHSIPSIQKIHLDDLSDEDKTSIADALQDAVTVNPIIGRNGTLKTIGTGKMYHGNGSIAEYYQTTGALVYNASKFNSPYANLEFREMGRTNHLAMSENQKYAYYITMHELGHGMHRGVGLRKTQSTGFVSGPQLDDDQDQILNDARKSLGSRLTRAEVSRGLSRYGASDPAETIAESFAESMVMGPEARPIAREVHSAMANRAGSPLKMPRGEPAVRDPATGVRPQNNPPNVNSQPYKPAIHDKSRLRKILTNTGRQQSVGVNKPGFSVTSDKDGVVHVTYFSTGTERRNRMNGQPTPPRTQRQVLEIAQELRAEGYKVSINERKNIIRIDEEPRVGGGGGDRQRPDAPDVTPDARPEPKAPEPRAPEPKPDPTPPTPPAPKPEPRSKPETPRTPAPDPQPQPRNESNDDSNRDFEVGERVAANGREGKVVRIINTPDGGKIIVFQEDDGKKRSSKQGKVTRVGQTDGGNETPAPEPRRPEPEAPAEPEAPTAPEPEARRPDTTPQPEAPSAPEPDRGGSSDSDNSDYKPGDRVTNGKYEGKVVRIINTPDGSRIIVFQEDNGKKRSSKENKVSRSETSSQESPGTTDDDRSTPDPTPEPTPPERDTPEPESTPEPDQTPKPEPEPERDNTPEPEAPEIGDPNDGETDEVDPTQPTDRDSYQPLIDAQNRLAEARRKADRPNQSKRQYAQTSEEVQEAKRKVREEERRADLGQLGRAREDRDRMAENVEELDGQVPDGIMDMLREGLRTKEREVERLENKNNDGSEVNEGISDPGEDAPEAPDNAPEPNNPISDPGSTQRNRDPYEVEPSDLTDAEIEAHHQELMDELEERPDRETRARARLIERELERRRQAGAGSNSDPKVDSGTSSNVLASRGLSDAQRADLESNEHRTNLKGSEAEVLANEARDLVDGPGINEDDRSSARFYATGSAGINLPLRWGKPEMIQGDMANTRDTLDRIGNAHTTKRDSVLFRGAGNMYDGVSPGDTVSDEGFGSFSMAPSIARGFDRLTNKQGGKVLAVNVPKGSNVIPMTQLDNSKGSQGEIVIPRGYSVKITHVDENRGIVYGELTNGR